MEKAKPPILKQTVLTVKETEQFLRKSHSQVYEAIGLGKLVALKDGRRTLVTVESAERYLAELPPAKVRPYRRRAA